MKYIMLCYDDENYWKAAGPAQLQQAREQAASLTHTLNDRGEYKLASPLDTSSTAVSVKVRDGKTIITDGPFAETTEVLGGFYLIDVDHLDRAIEIAAQHPGVHVGAVEIRPIAEVPGLPVLK